MMKKSDIERFFANLAKKNPAPRSELYYTNSFTLLVAVILSAQATDKGVNAVTRDLFRTIASPADILALGEKQLSMKISSIGLWKNKARHIVATAKILRDKHQSCVPDDIASLMALPGVGRKTANVVCNEAFGAPCIAVDTHVFRVSNRTGLAPGKTVTIVEQKLLARVPDSFKMQAHHLLILHGRYVCKARRPDCPQCVVRDICHYEPKTL